MSIIAGFVRINSHMEKHKMYYALLEATIILGALYTFGVMSSLKASWLTQHISNLIGSLFLMLVIIGPMAFNLGKVSRIYIAAFIVVALNMTLELSEPINTINLPYFTWKNFNTPDPADALFGVFGVLIVFACINILIRRKDSCGQRRRKNCFDKKDKRRQTLNEK